MSSYPELKPDPFRLADRPSGIILGIGSATMVAVTILAAAFTDFGSLQRILVMAIAAGVAAAIVPDWRHGLLLAVIGYLLYVGFLVNQEGELSWHGRDIGAELLAFGMSVWIGLGQRWMRVKAPSKLSERP